jgi:hypothetical protein
MAIDAHRDVLVLHALSGIQNQPRTLNHAKRQRRRVRPPLKLDALSSAQLDPIPAGPRHHHYFAAPH